jgi:transposase
MTQHTTFSDLRKLDPEALVALVLAQREQLLSRDTEIEHLKLLIAKLRRLQFGRSSEKLNRQIDQLELKLEELQTSQAEKDPVVVAKEAAPKRRRKYRHGDRCRNLCRGK